ncbi:MAG TPA: helix-turn-helix domain-containing protein, partial [Gallicola sp.]|nr:helix-turn-helix domain-containing protein [Gallicola sp.]
MNNDKLKSIIEEAREKKKISQRQLAKLTGYSH